MEFIDLGSMPFEDALRLQAQAVEEVARGGPERVLLVEHPPVFTLGSGADPSHLIRQIDPDGHAVPVHRTNRGGEVTFHGPGQLVGYPHLNLARRGRDLHRYLRELEEVLIETVAHFGVRGYRRHGLTGVWTDAGKLASIGIGVRHWVTMHGFALNVATRLDYFDLIDPCGIPGCPVTSLQSLSQGKVRMEEVKRFLKQAFVGVFGESAQVSGQEGAGKSV